MTDLASLEELCVKMNGCGLRKSEAWDALRRAEARAQAEMQPLTTRAAVEARLAYEMAVQAHEQAEKAYADAVRHAVRSKP